MKGTGSKGKAGWKSDSGTFKEKRGQQKRKVRKGIILNQYHKLETLVRMKISRRDKGCKHARNS